MEGKREQQSPDQGKRKLPMMMGGAAAVLLAGYIGLCAWVGAQDQVMPNVSVSGMDLSGMTAEEVTLTVDSAESNLAGDVSVKLVCGSWSGVLTGRQLNIENNSIGPTAVAAGREHFLTQGFQYIRHLLGGSTELSLNQVTVRQEQPDLDALLEQMRREAGFDTTQASYEVKGDKLVMTKGKTGLSIDRERVLFSLTDAMAEAYDQAMTGTEGQAQVVLDVTDMTGQNPPEKPDFQAIYDAVYTEVKDAAMDPETYKITEEQNGVEFDRSALEQAYEQAGEGTTFSVPLTITKAKETKSTLESKLFKDVLGQATSKVGGSANRKNNVKLAAAACNGKILLPGEVFSYNNTTGSRTADKGYLAAPIYVGGKSQDDIGGGICQPSSTLYYAVLHTTLEIVERHNHTFAVGYVPDGMDATVFYGSLDFRFKNSTDYPIKIVTESYDQGGSRYLRVKILGTNADGRYAKPERTQFDWVEPTTVYKADSSVPRGTLVLDKEQYAYKGRKAQTYRYIYEKDGTLVEKQDLGVSRYKMRPNTYYYNPADGDPATWVNGQPPKPVTEPTTPVAPTTPTTPTTPENPDPGIQNPDSSQTGTEQSGQTGQEGGGSGEGSQAGETGQTGAEAQNEQS